MNPKLQKDNSTIDRKVALRRRALKCIAADGQILETHGGYGRIYERVYYRHPGVVIEWTGYYCGANNDMTHYHATLERQ